MGRKIIEKDQFRGNCICGKLQAIAPSSKKGYKRYTPLCNSCNKKKYRTKKPSNYIYRKHKKSFCSRCGFIGEPCQLDVHHIDHNHTNNKVSNLLTLCANCHRLEHKK